MPSFSYFVLLFFFLLYWLLFSLLSTVLPDSCMKGWGQAENDCDVPWDGASKDVGYVLHCSPVNLSFLGPGSPLLPA